MRKLQIFLHDGTESMHELTEDVVTIGRLTDNTIRIDDVSVSSHHAQFTISGGGEYRLKDLNSTNGTRVNGSQISESPVYGGDKLRFGKIEAFYLSGVTGATQAMPEAERAVPRPGESSQRPADFANASMLAGKFGAKDPVARGIMGFALFSILVFIVAAISILTLQPPQ